MPCCVLRVSYWRRAQAQAAALIESGHKAISSARFHSPVLLHAQHFAPQPQHEHHPVCLDFPVVLGHYVYFAASDDDRRALADQPTRFLPAVPAPARVPPKIIVMGGPKSGRSTLARDLARDFGCVRLSMSRVIEWVVKGTLLLGKQLSELLAAGQDVPDELCIAALDLRLSSCECVSNGWVLDGFPTTVSQVNAVAFRLCFSVAETAIAQAVMHGVRLHLALCQSVARLRRFQVELLEAAGIVAHKIFFLDVSGTEMLLRSQRKFEAVARTRGSVPKLDAMAIAETNIEQHELSQRDLLAAICAKRDNVHVVDGERSKFWLHTHCRTVHLCVHIPSPSGPCARAHRRSEPMIGGGGWERPGRCFERRGGTRLGVRFGPVGALLWRAGCVGLHRPAAALRARDRVRASGSVHRPRRVDHARRHAGADVALRPVLSCGLA